jgi:hypothetical protein
MLTGPYTGLGAGICYALTGWRLFGRHNWARLEAMLRLAFGAAVMLPNLTLGRFRLRGWTIISGGLQIAVRIAGVFYLLDLEIIDLFVRRS